MFLVEGGQITLEYIFVFGLDSTISGSTELKVFVKTKKCFVSFGKKCK